MKKKQQKRLMAGLFTALGTVSAVFGIRALVSWYRRRPGGREFQYGSDQQYGYSGQRMAEIPVTNASSEMGTPAGVMDQPSTTMPGGTDFRGGAGTTEQTPVMPSQSGFSSGTGGRPEVPEGAASTIDSDELGENYRPSFRSQGDENEIPTTGGMDAPIADMPRTMDRAEDRFTNRTQERPQSQAQARTWNAGEQQSTTETDQPVAVSALVGPLIVHLLSFHNMMTLLKRRRDAQENINMDLNTPDVREGGADAVSSLEAQIPEFDHAALVQNSLQAKMVQMMERLRGALQDKNMSEDDLFHLNDELSQAVCKLLGLIHQAQEDNVTGFEDVQKAYHC